MADSDYNTIQPIEGLQNVLGIAPTEQQQQQRRKNAQEKRRQHSQPAQDEKAGEKTSQDNQDESHLIDYRA